MSETNPEAREQAPHVGTDTKLSEQELAEAIEHELASTQNSTHQIPAREKVPAESEPAEKTQEHPAAPKSEAHRMSEYERPGYLMELEGISVEYGRPIEVLEEKTSVIFKELGVGWMPTKVKAWKLRERIAQKEIIARITSDGDVRILDGNTTLYAALKCGIDPRELKVVYTVASRWHDEGPEYRHETLSDLTRKVRGLIEPGE